MYLLFLRNMKCWKVLNLIKKWLKKSDAWPIGQISEVVWAKTFQHFLLHTSNNSILAIIKETWCRYLLILIWIIQILPKTFDNLSMILVVKKNANKYILRRHINFIIILAIIVTDLIYILWIPNCNFKSLLY